MTPIVSPAPRGQLPPLGELRARGAQDLVAERDRQAGLVRHRQHLGGLAVGPAAERLEADDAARRRLHDRLVDDLERAVLDRLAQLALHVEPAHHLVVHGGVEHGVAALAVGLGAVHGDVGVAHHLLRLGLGGRERDPDRGADEQLAPVEQERRLQAVQDALGDDRRLARVADVVEQERELVAAESRDRVVRSQR